MNRVFKHDLTVARLIDELAKLDPSLPVYTWDREESSQASDVVVREIEGGIKVAEIG